MLLAEVAGQWTIYTTHQPVLVRATHLLLGEDYCNFG